jgi:hypothetical protein
VKSLLGGGYMQILKMLVLMFVYAALIAVWGETKAGQSEKFGDYIIHYNTVTTDNLQPQIAKLYGITRSNNRALLTVLVLKKTADITTTPVKAQLQVNAVNLNNQMKLLSMREITEDGAIYYIGEFPISNEETLDFDLTVTTDGSVSHSVAFRKQFFTD